MTCRFEQQGGLCRGRGPTRPSDAKAAASPQQCRGGGGGRGTRDPPTVRMATVARGTPHGLKSAPRILHWTCAGLGGRPIPLRLACWDLFHAFERGDPDGHTTLHSWSLYASHRMGVCLSSGLGGGG